MLYVRWKKRYRLEKYVQGVDRMRTRSLHWSFPKEKFYKLDILINVPSIING